MLRSFSLREGRRMWTYMISFTEPSNAVESNNDTKRRAGERQSDEQLGSLARIPILQVSRFQKPASERERT